LQLASRANIAPELTEQAKAYSDDIHHYKMSKYYSLNTGLVGLDPSAHIPSCLLSNTTVSLISVPTNTWSCQLV
jgi:hypothetical protein